MKSFNLEIHICTDQSQIRTDSPTNKKRVERVNQGKRYRLIASLSKAQAHFVGYVPLISYINGHNNEEMFREVQQKSLKG